MAISYQGPPKVGKVHVVDKTELNLIKANSDMTLGFIIARASEAVSACVVDGLAEAQPRVPWDTGELRKSGRASLTVGVSGRVVAKGKKGGTVALIRKGDPLKFWSWNTMVRNIRARPKIDGFITYKRSKGDRDIAIWTHENLNPHDTRPNPPAARKPGTGPKYLEIAVNERKEQWIQAIFNSVRNVPFEIKHISQITRGQTRYSVDRVKLIMSRIRKKGYFGR